ncbi:hypothetical protein [Bradyrhizobium iriomotense]|uniref:hypothetical protein n=1 Tax=Bradyrhizobium iriomotense TaxID=441950 RepID=UPI001B89F0C2|nr:hypothetical protein [Bradyrhizobium iriomotense]MBR0786188.1 hypothetical protein [Bradyrhizobium iriomotense]
MVQFLNKQEAMDWCSGNGVALSAWKLPDHANPEQKFDIPVDAQKRVNLVKRVMEEFADTTSLLVWFDDWMVWPSGQWMPLVSRLRQSYGETRRLIDVPAQLFEQGEIEDATSFVVIAVLFLFDCYVICRDQRRMIFFSHDEWGLAKNIPAISTD